MNPATEWKVLTVKDEEPVAYAAKLQEALQYFSDNGYQLTSHSTHGGAMILVACRMPGAMHKPAQPPTKSVRRVVTPPADLGAVSQEVLYTYQTGPGGMVVTDRFGSMGRSLSLLKEHLAGNWPMPIQIIDCTMTTYSAKSFVSLLRSHEKELDDDNLPG